MASTNAKQTRQANTPVKPLATAKAAPKKVPAKKVAVKKIVVEKATLSKPGKASKAAKDPVTVTVTVTETSAPAPVKQKLVRDSFTMPRADFDLIDVLKARALVFHRPAKKSELLRAGLHALAALTDAQLRKGLETLVPLKAGRPKNAE